MTSMSKSSLPTSVVNYNSEDRDDDLRKQVRKQQKQIDQATSHIMQLVSKVKGMDTVVTLLQDYKAENDRLKKEISDIQSSQQSLLHSCDSEPSMSLVAQPSDCIVHPNSVNIQTPKEASLRGSFSLADKNQGSSMTVENTEQQQSPLSKHSSFSILNSAESPSAVSESNMKASQVFIENLMTENTQLKKQLEDLKLVAQQQEVQTASLTKTQSPSPVSGRTSQKESDEWVHVNHLDQRSAQSEIQKQKATIQELLQVNHSWDDHCKKQTQEFEEEKKKLAQQLTDSRRDLTEMNEKINQLSGKLMDYESQNEVHQQRLQLAESEKEELRQKNLELNEKVIQLESRSQYLQRQNSQQMLFQSVHDSFMQQLDPSLPRKEKELRSEMAVLQQQITVFKDDFNQERRDRENLKMQFEVETTKTSSLQKELESSKAEVARCLRKLQDSEKENSNLKEKIRKLIESVKKLERQVNTSHEAPRPETDVQWQCARCTFKNSSHRSRCKICNRPKSDGNSRELVPRGDVVVDCILRPGESKSY